MDDGEFDRRHIWHPYSRLDAPAHLAAAAEGCHITLRDGRRLLDGMASWWAAIHGYNHPRLNAALVRQSRDFAHLMFGGLGHGPAVRLGRRLLRDTGMDAVFFADSGSVAVEVALKMAWQCQQGRGERRGRLMTLRGGYHGDTFATMALCDPDDGMHGRFGGLMYEPVFLPRPPGGIGRGADDGYGAQLERIFAGHGDEAAALVLEPIVQNAGGIHIYSPAVLEQLGALCRRHGVLMVMDEIATGFGRTGELFAFLHSSVRPDILCLGKALSGGYLSLAATLCSRSVARGVGDAPLMHGPTYMGNALACAVALASLELLDECGWRARVARMEAAMRGGLEGARTMPGVRDVRVQGGIAAIQLERRVELRRAQDALMERGVWLRPFRDLIYAMPPYIIGDGELEQLCRAMLETVAGGHW